jgi:hypothetical protein
MNIGFALPDAIFDIPEKEEARHLLMISLGEDFCSLDDRHFVSVILSIPVGGKSSKEIFTYGVWIEVADYAEFRRIAKKWVDPCAYASLSFTGKLANEIGGSQLGAIVTCEAPKYHEIDETKPAVVSSGSKYIQKLLTEGWTEEEYLEAVIDEDNDEVDPV